MHNNILALVTLYFLTETEDVVTQLTQTTPCSIKTVTLIIFRIFAKLQPISEIFSLSDIAEYFQ